MSIESVLHENRIFEPSEAFKKQATVSGMEAYNKLCAEAAADYEGFWAKLARELLVWHKPFTKTLNESNAPFYKWFEDGELPIASINTSTLFPIKPRLFLKLITATPKTSPTKSCIT